VTYLAKFDTAGMEIDQLISQYIIFTDCDTKKEAIPEETSKPKLEITVIMKCKCNCKIVYKNNTVIHFKQ